MQKPKITYSKLSIIVVCLTIIVSLFGNRHWKSENRVIAWDVVSYYAYLPATFIYFDPSLEFIDDYKGKHKFVFWPETAPNGKKVIKTSMGLSFLYSPFFFFGHVYALTTDYDPGGFSAPYKFMLLISNLFYLLIGLIFLRKILLRYFSEEVSSLSILLVFFATNLQYYSTHEATMSHGYSFSLFAGFIFLTISWYKKPSLKNTVLMGLLSGLIVLVRPTNILILLFFVFWDIKNIKDLQGRLVLFYNQYRKLLIMAFFAFLVWLPQLLYWKIQTGNFLYFSYGDEGFFFDKPQIISGLFGYRKGWLLYSPIMIFALAGVFVLKNNLKAFFLPVLLFVGLNIYVVLSWWAWWYGGSFGLRAFIDSYAILIFPLAAIISVLFNNKKKKIRIIVLAMSVLFIAHGIFQTRQYYHGAIHWDSMSKAAYWNSFGRLKPTKEFNGLLIHPDYEKAKRGEE
ncbi:MAG: hypothetical protein B6I20_02390 [Bacteroidetes bacterium 4572_117]|nr:MAG: hypothetical protein B6I20_02390 [Bacteroidetes bacterium 4572_117]